MKTHNLILLIIINIIMNTAAHGDTRMDLDFVFTGSTRAEIVRHEDALLEKCRAGSFDNRVYYDVTSAIYCIRRHANLQEKLGFTEEQCDEYFITLVGNKTVRNIILAAAAIALSESNDLPLDEDAYKILVPNSDEYRKFQYMTGQRTMGKSFLETYSLTTKTKAPDSKDAQK